MFPEQEKIAFRTVGVCECERYEASDNEDEENLKRLIKVQLSSGETNRLLYFQCVRLTS